MEIRLTGAEESIDDLNKKHIPSLQAGLDRIETALEDGFGRVENSMSSLGQNILLLFTATKK